MRKLQFSKVSTFSVFAGSFSALWAVGCTASPEVQEQVNATIGRGLNDAADQLSTGNWIGAVVGSLGTASAVGGIYLRNYLKTKERTRLVEETAKKVKEV